MSAARHYTMAPSRRGELLIERSVWLARPGVVGLRQRFIGHGERVIVTHDASLVAVVRVLEGVLRFRGVSSPARFVLSVPPRSVVTLGFEGATVESEGLGRLGSFSPGGPELRVALGDSLEGALAGPSLLALPDVAPPAVARARLALHLHLSDIAPVRAAALTAGLAPETLTRAFDRAYGLTPKQYCTRARLFDAAIALFTGAPIITAAFAAGFNDLSRFYAQFKRLLGSTPGDYAAAGNRQDST